MIFDKVVRFYEDAVCILSLLLIVVLILTQVFYHYVLSSGILWIDELVINLMIVMVLTGAARATRVGAHTDLRMLVNATPPLLSKVLRVAGILATYGFLLLLTYFSALCLGLSPDGDTNDRHSPLGDLWNNPPRWNSHNLRIDQGPSARISRA